jgi:hypothetical protein
LSCQTFTANAVWFQLHALAYNLGNLLRRLATPESIKELAMTKDKLRPLVAFQKSPAPQVFQEILRLIADLRPQPPPATA